MNSRMKLVAAVLVACACLVAVLAASLTVLGSGLEGQERAVIEAVLERRLGVVVMIVIFACVFLFLILRAVHEFLVLPPARAAEEAGAMLNQPATRLSLQGSGELQALIGAVNRLAGQHQARDEEIEARIRAANAAAEADRNRFAVLMAELAQGVIVCNMDGRVLLYNRRARALFAGEAGQGMAALGLGRSIYGIFDRHLIAYALENFDARRNAHRHFVAATASGRLLRVLVAPIPEAGAATARCAAGGGRLLRLHDHDRGHDGDLRQRIEARPAAAGPDREQPRAGGQPARRRRDALRLQRHGRRGPASASSPWCATKPRGWRRGSRPRRGPSPPVLKARWPLEEMLGADLLTAARRRIADRCGLQVSIEDVDAGVWLKVDGFSMLQAMTYFAARLRDEYQIRDLKLRLGRDGAMAHVDLIWSGVFMSTETVMQWELDALTLAGESSPLTVRDIVERNGGEVWFQRDHAAYRAFFRFLLPAISAQDAVVTAAGVALADSRPEFYDFDLFKSEETDLALDDRVLAQLAFTVFDTETTGLEPSAGDEIIQIGAVRIVNRRLLRHEAYEQLIDPQRSLPPASVKIHGITPEMLAGQPPIAQVLPVFRAFVADTVLVAHNAAFDMRFLELKEAPTGIRFDRPVLDTFLLSAVLFPNQETHRLEAIAERLGVSVMGRHTAVGDAIVTAEVFLKMLPLLAEKGIRTLGQAREASEKTYHARITY
jgi:DNA polymerase-3 subunit epsilon